MTGVPALGCVVAAVLAAQRGCRAACLLQRAGHRFQPHAAPVQRTHEARAVAGREDRRVLRAQEFVDDQELQVPAWSAQRWTLAERVTSGVTLAFAAAAIEIFAFGSRSALLLPR